MFWFLCKVPLATSYDHDIRSISPLSPPKRIGTSPPLSSVPPTSAFQIQVMKQTTLLTCLCIRYLSYGGYVSAISQYKYPRHATAYVHPSLHKVRISSSPHPLRSLPPTTKILTVLRGGGLPLTIPSILNPTNEVALATSTWVAIYMLVSGMALLLKPLEYYKICWKGLSFTLMMPYYSNCFVTCSRYFAHPGNIKHHAFLLQTPLATLIKLILNQSSFKPLVPSF